MRQTLRAVLLVTILLLGAGSLPSLPADAAQSRPGAAPPSVRLKAAVDRRRERMKQVGRAVRTLSGYGKGDVKDARQAQQAAAVVAAMARDMPALWPAGAAEGAAGGKTKAAAWTDRRGFEAEIAGFGTASAAMTSAAATGGPAAVSSQLAALGRTCRSCHAAYQVRD